MTAQERYWIWDVTVKGLSALAVVGTIILGWTLQQKRDVEQYRYALWDKQLKTYSSLCSSCIALMNQEPTKETYHNEFLKFEQIYNSELKLYGDETVVSKAFQFKNTILKAGQDSIFSSEESIQLQLDFMKLSATCRISIEENWKVHLGIISIGN